MDSNKGNTMDAQYKSWDDLSEKEQLECIYCEMYKDVYGVKARWYHADTVEQAREDVANLQKQGELVWAREKEEEERRVVAFEARVQVVIDSGAKDRATALRWIHDAEGTDNDDERLCYQLDLPFTYFHNKALTEAAEVL
jgi:hypothetical protein